MYTTKSVDAYINAIENFEVHIEFPLPTGVERGKPYHTNVTVDGEGEL